MPPPHWDPLLSTLLGRKLPYPWRLKYCLWTWKHHGPQNWKSLVREVKKNSFVNEWSGVNAKSLRWDFKTVSAHPRAPFEDFNTIFPIVTKDFNTHSKFSFPVCDWLKSPGLLSIFTSRGISNVESDILKIRLLPQDV